MVRTPEPFHLESPKFLTSLLCLLDTLWRNFSYIDLVHVPNFGGLSGTEDRGGGDNSNQFINIERVGDKSFKEWRRKIGGWKGG